MPSAASCLQAVLALFVSSPAEAFDWPHNPDVDVEITRYAGIEVVAPEHPVGTPLYDNQLRANLLQALIVANPFEAPEAAIQENLDALVEEIGEPELTDTQKADLRIRAAFAVNAGVVLQYVAGKEGIQATNADLQARFATLASDYGKPVESVKAQFVGHEDALRRVLVEEKTIAWLLERAKLR